MRRQLVLLLVTLVGGIAHADDAKPAGPAPGGRPAAPPLAPPAAFPVAPGVAPNSAAPTPERAADEFLKSWKSGDAEGLSGWAERADPWLVTAELLSRGEAAAAANLARLVAGRMMVAGTGGPLRSKLPDYVAGFNGRAVDRDAREALRLAQGQLVSGSYEAAFAGLRAARSDDPVLGAQLTEARARALMGLSRKADAFIAFADAARVAEDVGWLDWAINCYDAALAAAELVPESAALADTLLRSGEVLLRSDRSPADDAREATPRIERALQIRVRRGDRSGEADALLALYAARTRTWETDELLWMQPKAVHLLERARDIRREAGDRAAELDLIGRLAQSYDGVGETRRASQYRLAAVANREEANDHEGVATALEALADGYATAGDHANELRTLLRLRAHREHGGNPDQRRDVVSRFVQYYCSIEDFDSAVDEAHAVLSEVDVPTGWFEAGTWAEKLGGLLIQAGRAREALGPLRRAAASLREHEPGEYAEQRVLTRLAEAQESLGEFEEAIKIHYTRLRFEEKDPTPGPKVGVQLETTALALDHLRLGRLDRALEYVMQAPFQDGQSPGGFMVFPLYGLMGRIRLAQGDPQAAMEYARLIIAALPFHDGDRDAAVEGGSQGVFLGEDALLALSDATEIGVTAAQRLSDPDAACEFLERNRANVLSTFLKARSKVASTAAPDELARVEVRCREDVASAAKAVREARDSPRASLIDLRDREAEFEAARESLRRVGIAIQRARTHGVREAAKSGIPEIQKTLEAGDAVVLYGVFPNETMAVVVQRSEARVVLVGSTVEIEKARGDLVIDRADASSGPTADRLRVLLIDPLGLGADVTRVLISPDGMLGYVPFSLLLGSRSVACLPSATAYRILRDETPPTGTAVLALGDPDYTARIDAEAVRVNRPRSGGRLMPLPGTAVEAKLVGDVILLGQDATEAKLEEAIARRARWRAVHLACHGLLDPTRPMFSSLAFTPNESDDGFLTVSKVLRLQVPADLVVLSACETGRGRVVSGEGIVGLTRAFMFAGSPRVICSLWKVDDEATRALMVKFYELWNPKDGKPGLPTAEALRKAQEFVKAQEKWKHPYFWAAWVLWGLPS